MRRVRGFVIAFYYVHRASIHNRGACTHFTIQLHIITIIVVVIIIDSVIQIELLAITSRSVLIHDIQLSSWPSS